MAGGTNSGPNKLNSSYMKSMLSASSVVRQQSDTSTISRRLQRSAAICDEQQPETSMHDAYCTIQVSFCSFICRVFVVVFGGRT
ncbi:unnamed protein product [Gongylonema pulchrum]|uniref:Ovule protein n=1 Tax=Gongylonema pulchrum TaxID=637853 RepID=A0A183DCC7_9BILA|nr:unnamed protein product [Gongylonema pulchrum]